MNQIYSNTGKVAIAHEAIKSPVWPAMTMGFNAQQADDDNQKQV